MHNNGNHNCRVCGYWDEDAPWGEDGKNPTYFFCNCCGVEHGYGDFNPAAAKKWREKWIANGAKWYKEETRPSNWDLQDQLKNVPPEFL